MANGRTETIKGFKSKSGKRFNACLVLKKEPVTEGSEKMHTVVAFDFDNVEDEIIKDVVCPLCGGQIKKTSFGYGCVNYKGDEPGKLPLFGGTDCRKDNHSRKPKAAS